MCGGAVRATRVLILVIVQSARILKIKRNSLAFGERSKMDMGSPLQEGTDHCAARQAKRCAVRRSDLPERLNAKQARSIGGNSS